MRYLIYKEGEDMGIDGWVDAVTSAQTHARLHCKKVIVAEIRPILSYELDYKEEWIDRPSNPNDPGLQFTATGVDLRSYVDKTIEEIPITANHIPDEEYRLCLEPGNKYWVEHDGDREMMICHEVDGKKLLWDGFIHHNPEDFKIIQGY